MDTQIANYKRTNAELAINLSEKRNEIKSLTTTLLEKCHELQEVRKENAIIKQELQKYKDKMQVWKNAMIEMIQNNTLQYSKLISISGATNIQKPKDAPNDGNHPSGQTNAPNIVITSPNQLIDVMRQQRQPENVTPRRHTEASIAPRTPRSVSPSPFGLSNIVEENTLDFLNGTANRTGFDNDEQSEYDHSSLSESIITTAEMKVECVVKANDKNSDNVAINRFFKNDDNHLAVEPLPLTSKENIEPRAKPAPKSIKEARKLKEEKLKEIPEIKASPPHGIRRRANTVISSTPNKSNLFCNDTKDRPKRKAAPVQMAEPKMNTKLRRN